ncbi:MAG TPA: LCP family protein [Candidatus Limnocylindria bacterium]|jgi:LCP family protein required for cell wall assembly|nr:LCP family protein [Candidatus Limnocylindria bacterium]
MSAVLVRPTEPPSTGSPPPRRPFRVVLRVLLALLVLLIAAAVAVLLVSSTSPRRAPRAAERASPSFLARVLPPPIPPPEQLFGKSFVRILLVGLDYDYDEKDMETSARARSDIIIATALDLQRHRAAGLSVPRDMVATLPNGTQAKINQAQSDGGIAESQTVVSQWLGTPAFDRYVVLRIDATKDLINAIGGIDVNVQNSDALRHAGPNGPLDYDDSWGHLHVHLKPGFQHLEGEQAVGYARFRHDWCSDPCRIMRQQQVIRAIVARLKNDKLNTLLHINDLLGVLHKDVQTNLTTQEELSLAYAFRDIQPSEMKTAQVPYTGDVDLPGYGDSIVADEAAKRKLVTALLMPVPKTP